MSGVDCVTGQQLDILKYKQYEGAAEIDLDRMACRGKILFIDDVVTYDAVTPAELRKEFEAAAEDYMETCVALGRAPQKPLKGLFNVRISPELHRAVSLQAIKDGVSQNELVACAIDAVCVHLNVNHDARSTVANLQSHSCPAG